MKLYLKKQKIGVFIPDIIVEDTIIVELKCCEHLLPEHQAQLINYLKVTGARIGLLVNFGKRKLDYKRLHHPAYPAACDPTNPVIAFIEKGMSEKEVYPEPT